MIQGSKIILLSWQNVHGRTVHDLAFRFFPNSPKIKGNQETASECSCRKEINRNLRILREITRKIVALIFQF
jgi:hypothetical protein